MQVKFSLPRNSHNSKSTTFGRDMSGNTYIAMKIKLPQCNKRVDSPLVLLGSDHSKMKRQRTISITSESSAIESKRHQSSVSAKANNCASDAMSSRESNTYSPRMMALLSSLEALDDKEQSKAVPKYAFNATNAPRSTPLNLSMSTNQAAVALLQQKQRNPTIVRSLTTRPAIHKIEDQPLSSVTTRQVNIKPLHSNTFSQPESCNVGNGSSALDSITRAVAAVTATTASTSEDIASSLSFEQNRIAGAAADLADVATKSETAFTHRPTIASNTIETQNLPLIPFAFPNMPPTSSTMKYGAVHLNHVNRSFSKHEPTARQIAIHNAVHSDYKKIYKPLQRPPRLPTPREALVVAATSTATPATFVCR